MDEKFSTNGLNWTGRGYFGAPVIEPPFNFPDSPPHTDPLSWWKILFSLARNNQFEDLEKLIEIYEHNDESIIREICTDLIADAGTNHCFTAFTELMQTNRSLEIALDIAQALSVRGRLGDIPLIMDTFIRLADITDSDIISTYISDMLEPGPGSLADPSMFNSLQVYQKAVEYRYQSLLDRYGTSNVLIYCGQKAGVESLAKMIIDTAHLTPSFLGREFRHRFEANTGIDCSRFYCDNEIQPLTVCTMMEKFLDSREVEKFVEGHRYFFGHPIPD